METSIFTAEACALDLALGIILKDKHKKIIIFSNSLSVLLSLNNKKKLEHPLIIKLLCTLHSTSNKEIIFAGFQAASAAKPASDLIPDKYNIPYTDLKPKINNFLHKNGNNAGIEIPIINYSRLNPLGGEWRSAFLKSRKEQVTLTQLRIGHSRLTHSFILKKEQQSQCSTCQKHSTIKHFLLEYKDFNDT